MTERQIHTHPRMIAKLGENLIKNAWGCERVSKRVSERVDEKLRE